MNLFHILLILIVFASRHAASKQISCESKSKIPFVYVLSYVKTCFMWGATEISSADVTIPPDKSIAGLTFATNRKISFLPLEVGKSFPNLLCYSASNCNVKSVSKKHLEKLGKLKELLLYNNQISTIGNDTFADLISLEYLKLNNNKIKSINGRLFEGLNVLKNIYLAENDCISENFLDPSKISTLSKLLTEKCGFEKNLATADDPSRDHFSDERQMKIFDNFYNRTVLELRRKTTENSLNLVRIASLEAKLAAAETDRNRTDSQNIFIRNICEKLEAQYNATCNSKIKECRHNAATKFNEIEELLNEKQKLVASLNERDQKIEILQKKLETISGNCNY